MAVPCDRFSTPISVSFAEATAVPAKAAGTSNDKVVMAKSEEDVCAADSEKVSITCSTQRGSIEGANAPLLQTNLSY